MFGRTVRPDVWPDFRAAAQSIMRPGPTLGQLLESVVWAAAQGRETRRTGWGRKDGPGHEPCARAGTGRRQLGTWFQGQLKAASRTGNQKRQIRTGGQGKRPRANGRERTLKTHGQRRQERGVPDGLVHVRPTSGPRLFAGALVSFRLQGSLSVLVACLSEEPVCRLPRFLRFLSALYRFFRQFFSFPGP